MFFLTGSWFYKCLIADLRNKGLVQTTKQVICQFGKRAELPYSGSGSSTIWNTPGVLTQS